MLNSNALSFVRNNRDKFLWSKNPGPELISRISESILVDGGRRIDVFVDNSVHGISSETNWISEDAFTKLVPYPDLAINSSRTEILVSAFSQWFLVFEEDAVVYSGGSAHQHADALSAARKELNGKFALLFWLDA